MKELNVRWAEELIENYHTQMRDAIARGNDQEAGVHAAHIISFHNAIGRVRAGRSASLANDPMFGRFFNINEYFVNPRAATPEDHVVNYG